MDELRDRMARESGMELLVYQDPEAKENDAVLSDCTTGDRAGRSDPTHLYQRVTRNSEQET